MKNRLYCYGSFDVSDRARLNSRLLTLSSSKSWQLDQMVKTLPLAAALPLTK
jgi:hypothetical protein